MMVKIVYDKGNPFIDIDGKRFEPAAFRSFRPRPDNVLMAARTGVELMQILVSGLPCTLGVPYSMYGGVWKGDGVYDFTPFDEQFAMFRRYAPNAYFNVMLQLDAPEWFAQTHPGEDGDSYNHLTELAMNEDWKRSAAEYLKAFIAYAEEKYGEYIWAYSFACGFCNEWFDHSMYDPKFNRDNTRLTKLWREDIGKPDAPVPTLKTLNDGYELRKPTSDEFRYLELATQQTSNLICFLAAEAQTVLKHQKLIGLFYGYAIMNDNPVYWNTNGYEQVWESPDIDMLYSPAAYMEHRFLDGVSSYQYTVDSIRLHGKLYLHENDHRTDLARFPLENGTVLHDCYNSFEEWREVFRRELCNVMQKQSAFWWFDFFGGYYSAPEYEAELKREVEVFREMAKGERHSNAEIAVFIDPMSKLCDREHSKLCRDELFWGLQPFFRLGAPFELYNQNDLPKLDLSRYRLFVFENGYLLSDELKGFIQTHLQDKTKLFVHGTGAWDGKEFSETRLSDVCGMNIARRENVDSTSSYEGVAYKFTSPIQPLFQVEDADAEVLARYQDGGVSCARKGNAVYSAVARIPWQLLRDVARAAGVHLWSEQGSGTAICSQFACAYTTLTENCELHMQKDGWYREVFSGERYECRDGLLRYHAEKGRTMLFVREDGESM